MADNEVAESKINISLAYQLHLLQIIERANNFQRVHDIVGVSREIEMLYEGLVDKIPEKERTEKHEVAQRNSNIQRNAITFLDIRVSACDQYNKELIRKLFNESAKKIGELNELCSDWKKELILIMSKNKMLVVPKKRIEDEM